MRAQRRPKSPPLRAEAEWQAERDWKIQRSIDRGLGIRPKDWWRYESGRPDLAEGPALGEDLYGHVLGPVLERAVERFRFLAATGELRPSEVKAIAAGEGDSYRWRQAIVGSHDRR